MLYSIQGSNYIWIFTARDIEAQCRSPKADIEELLPPITPEFAIPSNMTPQQNARKGYFVKNAVPAERADTPK